MFVCLNLFLSYIYKQQWLLGNAPSLIGHVTGRHLAKGGLNFRRAVCEHEPNKFGLRKLECFGLTAKSFGRRLRLPAALRYVTRTGECFRNNVWMNERTLVFGLLHARRRAASCHPQSLISNYYRCMETQLGEVV